MSAPIICAIRSSSATIRAVSPEYVIFLASHKHRHPRKSTAERYLNAGVDIAKMFRTDLGDDEGSDEWAHGRQTGNSDEIGDDDVEIAISPAGQIGVKYR